MRSTKEDPRRGHGHIAGGADERRVGVGVPENRSCRYPQIGVHVGYGGKECDIIVRTKAKVNDRTREQYCCISAERECSVGYVCGLGTRWHG